MGSASVIALDVFKLFGDGKYGVLSINGVLGVFSILQIGIYWSLLMPSNMILS